MSSSEWFAWSCPDPANGDWPLVVSVFCVFSSGEGDGDPELDVDGGGGGGVEVDSGARRRRFGPFVVGRA